MSYQERRILVNLAGTVLVNAVYAYYMWQRYPQADPYSAEIFRFWGWFFVILVAVSIVARIVIHIIFYIVNTIATRIEESSMTDERDEMIELKASRVSLYCFAIGFLLAMAAIALGQPPVVMFIILFAGGLLASLVSDGLQIFYYQRGV